MIVQLISPLKATFIDSYDNEMDATNSLVGYETEILAALQRDTFNFSYFDSDEFERGLAAYFDEDSLLDKYVKCAKVTIRKVDGELKAVCFCSIDDDVSENPNLLNNIIDMLKEEIEGQYSDGWGEGFEQRAISNQFGDIYVSFWNSENWKMDVIKPVPYEAFDKISELIDKVEEILKK
jgi:hypothetical protein